MPASDPASHRSLTLPNGLRVALCSSARLKRCAAALRVAAGSHDVDTRWPGLAHFLEHLFFLGTERFPADQNLMAYVQRHGGQVNASTRERTTDFFFELAPAAFADGLDRLCEMLAHPRMTLADQLREREVLHAEFIAWSRDEASRAQLTRLSCLSALHPLRGFHAGNRFSLPVPRRAFQQALQDFYRRFYQAGQMTLSLAGPQSLDELQALATRSGQYFAKGNRVEQLRPPALVEGLAEPTETVLQQQLHLLFACEGLPNGHQQAAAFLCTWMNNSQSGGLVAHLRDQGLIESLNAGVLYEFDGQVLLDVDITLKTGIVSAATEHQVIALFFSWLTFFKNHYQPLLSEYDLLEQRRLAVSGALPLARHYCRETDRPVFSDQSLCALDALLGSLTPLTLLRRASEGRQNNAPDIDWRLPPANPFLRPRVFENATSEKAARRKQTKDVPDEHRSRASAQDLSLPSFTFSESLPANGEGALYLLWTLATPQPALARMLNDSLHALTADAEQAGITLAFTAQGNRWQLKLTGLAAPLPAVLEHALDLLGKPDDQTLSSYGQPSPQPAPIAIRQLLKTLPDHFLNSTVTGETRDLQQVWAHARWTGLAIGMPEPAKADLMQSLQRVPGKPDTESPRPAAVFSDRRWHTEPSDSSENAVLLFYPTPSLDLADEAIWRLLAHTLQAPFYQRLRVELQLGYAVFSGFRQIFGQGGLIFGVQSPGTSVEDLIEHIQRFLQTLPMMIEKMDLSAQTAALQTQLDPATLEIPQTAEMLWQAYLAGHTAHYPELLSASLAHSSADPLQIAARRIALPQSPRLCLSNRSKPSGS